VVLERDPALRHPRATRKARATPAS